MAHNTAQNGCDDNIYSVWEYSLHGLTTYVTKVFVKVTMSFLLCADFLSADHCLLLGFTIFTLHLAGLHLSTLVSHLTILFKINQSCCCHHVESCRALFGASPNKLPLYQWYQYNPGCCFGNCHHVFPTNLSGDFLTTTSNLLQAYQWCSTAGTNTLV